MNDVRVPVPDEIAPFVQCASFDGLCVLQASACSAAPLRLDWTAFLLPPSREDVVCSIDGVSFSFSKDLSHFLLPAGRGQTIRSSRTGPCRPYLCCFFDTDYLQALARELFDVPRLDVLPRFRPATPGLRDDIARLLDEGRTGAADSRRAAESLKTLVAIGCLRSILPEASGERAVHCRHAGVGSALRHIVNNLESPLTVETLATQAHVGKSSFIVLFRKETGLTPHEYVRRARVDRAMQMLRDGEDVTHTCFAVGFTSMSGFEEAFSSLVHMNPVEYRALSRS